jgi:hypothetical protein
MRLMKDPGEGVLHGFPHSLVYITYLIRTMMCLGLKASATVGRKPPLEARFLLILCLSRNTTSLMGQAWNRVGWLGTCFS